MIQFCEERGRLMTNSLKNILLNTPLFANLSDDEFSFLMNQSGVNTVDFCRGDRIFPRDKSDDDLCIMIDGTAESLNGNTLLNKFEKGDIFGAASLFCSQKYPTVIFAKTKGRVLCIKSDAVINLMKKSSVFSINYVRFLSGKIYLLNKKIDSFTANNAVQKTAKYIYEISSNRREFDLPVSISRLSSSLDIGRASLYRAFDVLEKQNIITRNQCHIEILNLNMLLQYSL